MDYGSLSSRELIGRAKDGDSGALGELFGRHFAPLRRWAHGRMPRWARSFSDTTDLVQDALLRTFRRLNAFEPRGHNALRAYLRAAVHNRIRDELRRIETRPEFTALTGAEPDAAPSPLTVTIASAEVERYRRALQHLTTEERELIVARVELGYNYEQLALLTGRRRADAARVALRRAIARLTDAMSREP